MAKILKLSNDVKITKSNIDIVKVEKKLENIPCTNKSWYGLYYSEEKIDISLEGYTLLSYHVQNFQQCSGIFYPMIKSDGTLDFMSHTSQTLTYVWMVFIYIRD